MIWNDIRAIVDYAIKNGLMAESDRIFATNELLDLLGLEEYEDPGSSRGDADLETTLSHLVDYAYQNGLLKENNIVCRDLFDTKIMGLLTPRPHEVIQTFSDLYRQSPVRATDYFYKLSQDTDYIRRYRIKKDIKWTSMTKYGALDITINLSKPEKDPKAIAAAKLAKQSGYPKM